MSEIVVSFTIQMHGKVPSDVVGVFSKVAAFKFPDQITKPLVLPFGQEGPAEFPRLLLEYKSGSKFLMDGKMFSFSGVRNHASDLEIETLRQQSILLFETISAELNFQPSKIASVVVAAYPNADPSLWIRDRFYKPTLSAADGPLNRPAQINFSAYKTYAFTDFNVNSWAHVKSETLTESVLGTEQKAVTFTSDLNTSEMQAFNVQQSKDFFDNVWAEHSKIRKLYMETAL